MNRFQARSVEDVKKDIKYWTEQSNACEWCPYGCWCDGCWSPEARLLDLEKELNALTEES